MQNQASHSAPGIETAPSKPLQSVGAFIGGFLIVAMLSTAADALCHRTGIYPPEGEAMAAGLWVLALAYRAVFQCLGGCVTAMLAPRNPRKHVLFLAVFGTIMAIAGAAANWDKGPGFGPPWYPITLALISFPTVWAGYLVYRRRNPA